MQFNSRSTRSRQPAPVRNYLVTCRSVLELTKVGSDPHATPFAWITDHPRKLIYLSGALTIILLLMTGSTCLCCSPQHRRLVFDNWSQVVDKLAQHIKHRKITDVDGTILLLCKSLTKNFKSPSSFVELYLLGNSKPKAGIGLKRLIEICRESLPHSVGYVKATSVATKIYRVVKAGHEQSKAGTPAKSAPVRSLRVAIDQLNGESLLQWTELTFNDGGWRGPGKKFNKVVFKKAITRAPTGKLSETKVPGPWVPDPDETVHYELEYGDIVYAYKGDVSNGESCLYRPKGKAKSGVKINVIMHWTR